MYVRYVHPRAIVLIQDGGAKATGDGSNHTRLRAFQHERIATQTPLDLGIFTCRLILKSDLLSEASKSGSEHLLSLVACDQIR